MSFLILVIFGKAIQIYSLVLLVRIVMSFINPDPWNPVVRFIYRITDPALDFINQFIPCRIGMIDFSPMVLMLLLNLIYKVLVNLLTR